MFVDGKPHPLDDGSPRAYIGSLSMDKSELRIFIIELPKRFEKPGKHRTQYKWTFCYIDREKLKLRRTSAKETFEGSSNEVEISISDNCGLN